MEARALVKRYGEREALKGVDLAVEAGELLAVIGPNGAGKTTLLSILAGIVEADEGEVSSPNGDVGWVPQQAALYRRLTVEENLLLFARLEGHDDPGASVEEMLELTGLRERRGEVVARLSGGNQQRINIAIGLLARPAALLLDEPSVGLDPRQRARLWSFFTEGRPAPDRVARARVASTGQNAVDEVVTDAEERSSGKDSGDARQPIDPSRRVHRVRVVAQPL